MSTLSIEHLAGPLTKYGIQRCRRCGDVLVDYRNAMVLEGSPPLSGFAVGPVYVTGRATSIYPIGDDAAPCQGPYHEHQCAACGEEWLHGYGGCERRGHPSDCCPACKPEGFV